MVSLMEANTTVPALHWSQGTILIGGLVLARITGFAVTLPIWRWVRIPMALRIALVLAATVLVTPTVVSPAEPSGDSVARYVSLLLSEVLWGAVVGAGLTILVTGLELGAAVVGQQTGLDFAPVLQPGIPGATPLSQFYPLMAGTVFLLIGGHRWLVSALLETFQQVPPGSIGAEVPLVPWLLALMSQSFQLGVQVAAPIIAALWLTVVGLGFLSRSLPQIQLLILGLPLRVTLGLVVIGISLAGLTLIVEQRLLGYLDLLGQLSNP